MHSVRIKTLSVAALLTVLAFGNAAVAGMREELLLGLNYYGVKVQQQYDPVMKGYVINVTGTDPTTGQPFYNNTNFDFGFADLTLGYGPSGVGDTFNVRAKYTKRVIPTVHLSMSTGNRPLDYRFKTHVGLEDVDVVGSLLMNVDMRVNKYGFYEVSGQISNRASVDTFGALGEKSDLTVLDYDVGPFSFSGNICVDAMAALTEPFFNAFGAENPFQQFQKGIGGLASLTTGVEDLVAKMASGQLLGDNELAQLINNSVLSSALGKQELSSKLFEGLLLPEDFLQPCSQCTGRDLDSRLSGMLVPEPGMLLLLTGLGTGFLAFSRKRSRR
jgi:hypothetical protein